jgi:2-hydroxy-6-oxonona-2,4-dienedioate hydrolase
VPRAGGVRALAAVTGLGGAGLGALAFRRYRRDIRGARERVTAGGTVMETSHGPIEFGSEGDGPPVLVVHGAGGGFDQGLEIAEPLVRTGFRVVAMSRFGYLRTPLPIDASPAAQADAHASLLDALDIPRAAVIGASAGAPSSMQFALRHPDRAAALVLLVPLAYPAGAEQRPHKAAPVRIPAAAQFLFDAALASDFLFWVASRVARGALIRAILGTPPSALRTASDSERARIARVLDHIQPLSMRRPGLLNDLVVARSLPRYELESIAAPTLVLGVADCLYGTYAGARYSAEHIPEGRFVSYPDGGHLLVGHQAEAMDEIAEFLRTAAPVGDS